MKKNYKKQLKTIQISRELLDYIKEIAIKDIVKVDSIKEFIYGYPDKSKIYMQETTKECKFVIRLIDLEGLAKRLRDGEIRFDTPYVHITDCPFKNPLSYQVIAYWKNDTHLRGIETQETLSGGQCYVRVMSYIKKKYSEDELKVIFNDFAVKELKDNEKQWHEDIDAGIMAGTVYKFNNVKYYDINGAHAYLLSVIFPKCKDYFYKIYEERKIKPQNKQLLNYFVGDLVNHGHRETYNWIVKSVTDYMRQTVRDLYGWDSKLIYVNTDGFAIQNPVRELETSTELGKFKRESSTDTMYVYADKNYRVIEYTDKNGKRTIKGSAFDTMKDLMNLSEGHVVEYTIVQSCGSRKPVDVKHKNVPIIEVR